MIPALQIRKTPDGRIQARRLDGKPLTAEDRENAKTLMVIEALPPRAWVVEEICDKAVKICSEPLEDHLWLVIDRSFEPADGLAIYYAEGEPNSAIRRLSSYGRFTGLSWCFPAPG